MSATSFKLDFSPLRAPKPLDCKLSQSDVKEGEHDLGGTQIMSPRANSERAITIRGAPKHRHELLFKVGPDMLGSSSFKFCWKPGGDIIATASMLRGELLLHLFGRDGTIKSKYNLGPGAVTWMEWDCTGAVLGLMQTGVGIFLWDLPPEGQPFGAPIALANQITVNATFCKWSKINQQLAIGTQQGKVNHPPSSCGPPLPSFRSPRQQLAISMQQGQMSSRLPPLWWLLPSLSLLGLPSCAR